MEDKPTQSRQQESMTRSPEDAQLDAAFDFYLVANRTTWEVERGRKSLANALADALISKERSTRVKAIERLLTIIEKKTK